MTTLIRYRVVTAYAELVCVGIPEVCAVVVRVILDSQARRPFAMRSVCERAGVCPINRLPVTRKQRHHLAISTSRGIAVIWLANKEQRPRCVRCHPSCPWPVAFAEFEAMSQFLHQSRIKLERAIEVVNAEKSVRDHIESLRRRCRPTLSPPQALITQSAASDSNGRFRQAGGRIGSGRDRGPFPARKGH